MHKKFNETAKSLLCFSDITRSHHSALYLLVELTHLYSILLMMKMFALEISVNKQLCYDIHD